MSSLEATRTARRAPRRGLALLAAVVRAGAAASEQLALDTVAIQLPGGVQKIAAMEATNTSRASFCTFSAPEAARQYSSVLAHPTHGTSYYSQSVLDSPVAWAAGAAWTSGSVEGWMEIDLGSVMTVYGFETQGSGDGVSEWVESYTVGLSETGYPWSYQGSIFTGNSDATTRVQTMHWDTNGRQARYVRYLPVTWTGWPSMRAGVLTDACPQELCGSTTVNVPETARSYSSVKAHPTYGTPYYSQSTLGSRAAWAADVAWTPGSTQEWMELDLGSVMTVYGFETQGNGDSSVSEWVESYTVGLSETGYPWILQGVIFAGNSDATTRVQTMHWDTNGRQARYVRFFPVTWTGWPSMRASVLTTACATCECPTPSPSAVPTPSPTANPTVGAIGDPHMTSVTGAKFDIVRPGNYTLFHIPRFSENALIDVSGVVSQKGMTCQDMYISSLDITGKWADDQQPGGFSFFADKSSRVSRDWMTFGKVQIKIVHGTTFGGVSYLNVITKHLDKLGMPIGGLLGLDDHTYEATPDQKCKRTISLMRVDINIG